MDEPTLVRAQVEPVRWPHTRMRKVLNVAVTGGGGERRHDRGPRAAGAR